MTQAHEPTLDITDKILKEQDADGQIERAFEKLRSVLNEKATELPKDVAKDRTKKPDQSWRDPVLKAAENVVGNVTLWLDDRRM